MTEKRFTTNGYYIYDHFKDDRWLVNEVEVEYIVTQMNNIDTKARERSKALSKLQKENEQLKKELHKIKVVNEMLSMDFANSEHELYKENEQLKQTIKEAYETERTSIGKSVLKQLLEAIQ